MMLGTSLLPAILRPAEGNGEHAAPPSWLNRKISPLLESLARRASTHPIHTIVFVLLLASGSYMRLLEGSLVESDGRAAGTEPIDLTSLASTARQLRLGEDTAWKWQLDSRSTEELSLDENHQALITLVFPHPPSAAAGHAVPSHDTVVPIQPQASVQVLPTTSNAFAPFAQDASHAYAIPWSQTQMFLAGLSEIPEEPRSGTPDRVWIAKASRNNGAPRSYRTWVRNAWSEFVDLLKNAETLDITIMFLGYVSMHLTFVSLFMSMRRMGSNFWLATTTLFSSAFAFSFGLAVTTKLGVPINMVLLSEGLPFLVVTVGFEKPIILTKAVLSASLSNKRHSGGQRAGSSPKTIGNAVASAVRARGYEIVRDYAIEIAILAAGAASGIQGGLRQFCFLAAWIMFFDCLLLFTFYTAILCVKLEINRIKRHVALRRALEEDGVSRRVAENVANRDEWPRLDDDSTERRGSAVFGKKVAESSVPKFKILLVGGFVLLNVINICTIPFRTASKHALSPTVSGIQGVLNAPILDPFKVAESGLDALQAAARTAQRPTVVTVLPPIKYELRSAVFDESDSFFDGEYDHILNSVGGRVIEGVLKSLEDPVLSKWIVVALTLSLALNGYLFNAARWSIKEPRTVHFSAEEPVVTLSPSVETPSAKAPLREPPEAEKAVANGHAKPPDTPSIPRSRQECEELLKAGQTPMLGDTEILELAVRGKIPGYALEKTLESPGTMTRLQSLTRAVKIRRGLVARTPSTTETTGGLDRSKLPYKDYNYENVHGACCENVIGYLPLPLGVAGPLVIDGQSFYLPMATTEGVLVASTNRGCKAINAGGGAVTVLTGDGMTRGPCVAFDTLARAGAAKVWLDSEDGQSVMKKAFDSTSRFARLQTMKTALAGTYLYIRFKTTTGDAMGMNMISKGVECALRVMADEAGFDDMKIISVSGNFCTDKKPAAINWIDGRGKSVVAEAIIPGDVVRKLLKSDVDALVELNTAKNLIGSAMAGSVGGFNAHAANLVAAMFLATGQDPAQVVESSNCITVMKNYQGSLQISVSMPCIEVGTIGGGTVLEPQQAMLDLLGVRGAHPTSPGQNARKLARIIAASVLAGELSLCSALAAGHLVRAHMAHNRSAQPSRAPTPVQSPPTTLPSSSLPNGPTQPLQTHTSSHAASSHTSPSSASNPSGAASQPATESNSKQAPGPGQPSLNRAVTPVSTSVQAAPNRAQIQEGLQMTAVKPT